MRVLPGVYVEFHDYSMLPEGETNLAVGYCLASPRGPVGKGELVTSPADFLSRFTLSGSPTIKDDKTFWSILQVLKYTNQVYISRVAKDVKFGGVSVTQNAVTPLVTGLDNPEDFNFNVTQPEEGEPVPVPKCALLGLDGGAEENKIGIEIVSYIDKGAQLVDLFENEEEMKKAKPFLIRVFEGETGNQLLEEFLVSFLDNAKAFDGSPLYIDTVLKGAGYIQCVLPLDITDTEAPKSTTARVMFGGGASADFNSLTSNDAIKALEVFEDKTIPISLLGNGTGEIYENKDYHQAMLSLAEQRQDFLAFLNSRLRDEKATMNSKKRENIVNYKKGASDDGLGSTTWKGCMYAPHVNYSDVFNSRKVKIGADSTAIAGWLNVILSQGYPYAYAGPQDGLVTGVTTDWKIGDTSGDATFLNDASINYVAYDAKVGRYYMQCQNTLQIANSSLRNIGAVLNVLDIKQTFMTYFKEYLQKPITTRLREEMWTKGNDYLKNDIQGRGRCINYTFVDATTDLDLADNTMRYVLTIALTPYAQKIYLTMNIVNASYDFTISQGA